MGNVSATAAGNVGGGDHEFPSDRQPHILHAIESAAGRVNFSISSSKVSAKYVHAA